MKKNAVVRELAVTALGLGRLPLAPGTWASAGALALWVFVWWVAPWPFNLAVMAVCTVLALWAGLALGPWAEQHYGTKDPLPFVLDEVLGQWATCLLLCFQIARGLEAGGWAAVVVLAAAFLAFRFMDIAKPWPIRRLETLPSGWGIVADDLLAGIYAGTVVLIGYVCYAAAVLTRASG